MLVLVVLVVSPLVAGNLWDELLPDHEAVMLSVSQNLNGQVLLAGGWEAFQLGCGTVEGDVWGISPLRGGLSWGGFGSSEHPRFVGVGYDGDIAGEHWYNRIVVYAKTPVRLNF